MKSFKNFVKLIMYSFPYIGLFFVTASIGLAYPFATYVMDAKTGKTLYGQNSETRLHPASLTKMMTLYIVFHEVESKRLKLDQRVTISRNAAREPPSKFGYKIGQKVTIRFLIRAAAIRSANDAATALAEAVSGSEKAFGIYMTNVAREMGMINTQFKNANGLTATNHFSSAKDMAILSRRLIYDFPEYYHLFGKNNVIASGKTLYNTNRKFLSKYKGADGIKTGFTSAAGYNLAASARRSDQRIIAVVFGSGSVSLRTKRMTELLNIGFSRASRVAKFSNYQKLNLDTHGLGKKRVTGAVLSANSPLKRPINLLNFDQMEPLFINRLVKDALGESNLENQNDEMDPLERPQSITDIGSKGQINLAAKLLSVLELETKEKIYEILVGSYYTEYNAKRDFSRLALSDLETLSSASRTIKKGVVNKKLVYRVNFRGLSKSDAVKACQRLNARNEMCEVLVVE